MSSTAWYIRLGDQVLGPISDADLRDRATQGSVTAQTPVSRDGTDWIEAATVDGIVFGPSPSGKVPDPNSRPEKDAWGILLWVPIVLVTVLLGLCFTVRELRVLGWVAVLAAVGLGFAVKKYKGPFLRVCCGICGVIAMLAFGASGMSSRTHNILTSADDARSKGVAALEKGDLDLALANFNEAIRVDPQFAEAYSYRGDIYREKRDYDKAIEDYSKAIQLNPKSVTAYVNRGHAYIDKGGNDKADADYNEAIRRSPQPAAVYVSWGDAWRMNHKSDKAIEAYSEAIRLDAKNDVAYRCRGMVYSEKAEPEFDKAIADCSDAARLNPRSDEAYMWRGIVYWKMGEIDKVIADCSEAIRLAPRNPKCIVAYVMRRSAYNKKGETSKAEADFEEAKRLGYNGK